MDATDTLAEGSPTWRTSPRVRCCPRPRRSRRSSARAEVHKLLIAYQWAIAHPALDSCETPSRSGAAGGADPAGEPRRSPARPRWRRSRPSRWRWRSAAPPRRRPTSLPTPSTCTTGSRCCGTRRAPRLVPVWKARRVATRTRHLSFDAAQWVDRQVAGRVSSLVRSRPRPAGRRGSRTLRRRTELAGREESARDGGTWFSPIPTRSAASGTSELRATGDTLDLIRFHDVVCAEAEALAAPRRLRQHRRPEGEGTRRHRRRPGTPRPDQSRGDMRSRRATRRPGVRRSSGATRRSGSTSTRPSPTSSRATPAPRVPWSRSVPRPST